MDWARMSSSQISNQSSVGGDWFGKLFDLPWQVNRHEATTRCLKKMFTFNKQPMTKEDTNILSATFHSYPIKSQMKFLGPNNIRWFKFHQVQNQFLRNSEKILTTGRLISIIVLILIPQVLAQSRDIQFEQVNRPPTSRRCARFHVKGEPFEANSNVTYPNSSGGGNVVVLSNRTVNNKSKFYNWAKSSFDLNSMPSTNRAINSTTINDNNNHNIIINNNNNNNKSTTTPDERNQIRAMRNRLLDSKSSFTLSPIQSVTTSTPTLLSVPVNQQIFDDDLEINDNLSLNRANEDKSPLRGARPNSKFKFSYIGTDLSGNIKSFIDNNEKLPRENDRRLRKNKVATFLVNNLANSSNQNVRLTNGSKVGFEADFIKRNHLNFVTQSQVKNNPSFRQNGNYNDFIMLTNRSAPAELKLSTAHKGNLSHSSDLFRVISNGYQPKNITDQIQFNSSHSNGVFHYNGANDNINWWKLAPKLESTNAKAENTIKATGQIISLSLLEYQAELAKLKKQLQQREQQKKFVSAYKSPGGQQVKLAYMPSLERAETTQAAPPSLSLNYPLALKSLPTNQQQNSPLPQDDHHYNLYNHLHQNTASGYYYPPGTSIISNYDSRQEDDYEENNVSNEHLPVRRRFDLESGTAGSIGVQNNLDLSSSDARRKDQPYNLSLTNQFKSQLLKPDLLKNDVKVRSELVLVDHNQSNNNSSSLSESILTKNATSLSNRNESMAVAIGHKISDLNNNQVQLRAKTNSSSIMETNNGYSKAGSKYKKISPMVVDMDESLPAIYWSSRVIDNLSDEKIKQNSLQNSRLNGNYTDDHVDQSGETPEPPSSLDNSNQNLIGLGLQSASNTSVADESTPDDGANNQTTYKNYYYEGPMMREGSNERSSNNNYIYNKQWLAHIYNGHNDTNRNKKKKPGTSLTHNNNSTKSTSTSSGIRVTAGQGITPLLINTSGLIVAAKKNVTGRPYNPNAMLSNSQVEHSLNPIKLNQDFQHHNESGTDLLDDGETSQLFQEGNGVGGSGGGGYNSENIEQDRREIFMKQPPMPVSHTIWTKNSTHPNSAQMGNNNLVEDDDSVINYELPETDNGNKVQGGFVLPSYLSDIGGSSNSLQQDEQAYGEPSRYPSEQLEQLGNHSLTVATATSSYPPSSTTYSSPFYHNPPYKVGVSTQNIDNYNTSVPCTSKPANQQAQRHQPTTSTRPKQQLTNKRRPTLGAVVHADRLGYNTELNTSPSQQQANRFGMNSGSSDSSNPQRVTSTATTTTTANTASSTIPIEAEATTTSGNGAILATPTLSPTYQLHVLHSQHFQSPQMLHTLNNHTAHHNATSSKPNKVRNKLSHIIIRGILKNQLHNTSSTASAASAAAAAAATAVAQQQQLSAAQLSPPATPPPLLSSTVANNVANLLAHKLTSLITRPMVPPVGGGLNSFFGLRGGSAQNQHQNQNQNQIGAATSTTNRFKLRLNPFLNSSPHSSINRRTAGVGSLLFSGFIYGLSVLPALMALTGINPLVTDSSANGGGSGAGATNPNAANDIINSVMSQHNNMERYRGKRFQQPLSQQATLMSAASSSPTSLSSGSSDDSLSSYAYFVPLITAANTALDEESSDGSELIGGDSHAHQHSPIGSDTQQSALKAMHVPAPTPTLQSSIMTDLYPLLDEPAFGASTQPIQYATHPYSPYKGHLQYSQAFAPPSTSTSTVSLNTERLMDTWHEPLTNNITNIRKPSNQQLSSIGGDDLLLTNEELAKLVLNITSNESDQRGTHLMANLPFSSFAQGARRSSNKLGPNSINLNQIVSDQVKRPPLSTNLQLHNHQSQKLQNNQLQGQLISNQGSSLVTPPPNQVDNSAEIGPEVIQLTHDLLSNNNAQQQQQLIQRQSPQTTSDLLDTISALSSLNEILNQRQRRAPTHQGLNYLHSPSETELKPVIHRLKPPVGDLIRDTVVAAPPPHSLIIQKGPLTRIRRANSTLPKPQSMEVAGGSDRFKVGYTLNYATPPNGPPTVGKANQLSGNQLNGHNSLDNIANFGDRHWRAVTTTPPSTSNINPDRHGVGSGANELLSNNKRPFYSRNKVSNQQNINRTKLPRRKQGNRSQSGVKLGSKMKRKKGYNSRILETNSTAPTTTNEPQMFAAGSESQVLLPHTMAMGSKVLNEPLNSTHVVNYINNSDESNNLSRR